MNLPTEKTKPETSFLKFNTLLYGLPKTGKTTFASTINDGKNVLFAATEKGYPHLSVFAVDIGSWVMFEDMCKSLKGSPYKVIVIDTIDILHRYCSQHVCKRNGWSDPSDGDYGKGFNTVRDEFMRVVNGLHLSGYSLVFISHAKTKPAKLPNGADITKMGTSMSDSVEVLVAGLADFLLYLCIDENNNRYIRTRGTPHFLAGDRSNKLPAKMPLDFKLIQKYLCGEIVKPTNDNKPTKEIKK